jgi:hypothetical protein
MVWQEEQERKLKSKTKKLSICYERAMATIEDY